MLRYVFSRKAAVIASFGIIIGYSSTLIGQQSIRRISKPQFATMSESKRIKVYLRHDQTVEQMGSFLDQNVRIYAPKWVEECLKTLATELDGVTVEISDPKKQEVTLEFFTITKNSMTLKTLQQISRNEPSNISGIYNMSLYQNLEKHELIIALKDLARQCVIIGSDTTTHYGGYPASQARKSQPNTHVYICDLAGLQFQHYYNTGRLVLIQQHEAIHGILDEQIFENVVGEKKRSFKEAISYSQENPDSNRYIKTQCFSKRECFFDSYAYQKFVAGDVILSGLAFAHLSSASRHKLNFKFLKYGSGFFAGPLQKIIDAQILPGVVMGLEEMFRNYGDRVLPVITHVELPFYTEDKESIKSLEKIKEVYGVTYSFTLEDALKITVPGLVTATTNCGDVCAVFGNEMNFGSVDATIAENLASRGNTFCPNLNKQMEELFIEFDQSNSTFGTKQEKVSTSLQEQLTQRNTKTGGGKASL